MEAQTYSELSVPFDDQINFLQLKNKPSVLAFFGDIAFLYVDKHADPPLSVSYTPSYCRILRILKLASMPKSWNCPPPTHTAPRREIF
jgi:hypothetical protein